MLLDRKVVPISKTLRKGKQNGVGSLGGDTKDVRL
jgi:hypothetical protein